LKASSNQGRAWTIEDVVTAVKQITPGPAVEVVQRLIGVMADKRCRLRTGKGQYPTVSADYQFPGGTRAIWAIYGDTSGPSAPRIVINFGSLRTIFGEPELESLLQSLETIDALRGALKGVRDAGFNSYPSIPLSALAMPGVLDRFLEVWEPWIPGSSDSNSG
jgi:hypothetical protein